MRALTLVMTVTSLTAALTLAGTLSPLPEGGGGVPGGDKLHHLLAFAAMAFPLSAVRPRWVPALVLVLAGFGGAIELVQPLVGRGREFADWIADLHGIALGALAGLLAHRLMRRPARA